MFFSLEVESRKQRQRPRTGIVEAQDTLFLNYVWQIFHNFLNAKVFNLLHSVVFDNNSKIIVFKNNNHCYFEILHVGS